MDFNHSTYITGSHQRQRLYERTDQRDMHKLMSNSRVVLIKGKNRYYRYKDNIIPVVKGEDGANVIKTVLTTDMYIYENNLETAETSSVS
jgi:hypothetical protein